MHHTTPLILCAALLALPGTGSGQNRMTPEMLWKLSRVSDPQVSADGNFLLFTVRKYNLAANAGRSQVYLLDLSSGKRTQVTEEGSNWSARWEPGGSKAMAFVSTRSGSTQIHSMDLDSRRVRQITSHPGGVANIAWSPAGTHFSFTASVRIDKGIDVMFPDLPKANARIYDDLMIRHWDHWKDGTYSHLFVISARGGKARDLMAGQRVATPLEPFGGGEHIDWSPDGTELCYTAKVVDAPEISTDSSLFTVSLDGSKRRDITPNRPGYDSEPRYSPDGRHVAWVSMARAGFESDRNRIMVLDRKSGAIRELTRGFDQSAHDVTWRRDSSGLYFTSDVMGTRQVYSIGVGGSADAQPATVPATVPVAVPAAITNGRFHFGSLVAGPGNTLLAARMQMERPFEIVRLDGSKVGQGELLTDENGPHYKTLQMPTTEAKWFQATDGKKIHAWVIYPPGFDKTKKYPMLLYCQGGPQSQVGQWFSYRWNFHLMAARGYVVLAVNRRGLPGFGQEWNDEISRDWGGQAMRDLLTATDAMFREPYIDRQRTGAVGASFGGYTIYWLMGHDEADRFKAMVAHCGVFNLKSMYLSTEELFFVNWDLGGPFWKSPEVAKDYKRFSPNEFIGQWQTPLLVIHGQKDFRVPVEQGIQAFSAAQLQGAPSRFLYFPEESHWVRSPQNSVLWHRVFFDWLDRYLK
jgi:dipeptidyl aminopeptidase/acylaminoacyl peptidase